MLSFDTSSASSVEKSAAERAAVWMGKLEHESILSSQLQHHTAAGVIQIATPRVQALREVDPFDAGCVCVLTSW